MRIFSFLFVGTVLTASTAAHAADELKFGKASAWVVPQAIPPVPDKAKDRPITMLLHDQQVLLEPGKITTYSELAFKIQKPEGLSAGNLSIAWNPAFDTPTVNRLEIRRGNQVIDVLKSGQTFTTMRRESNLELAMLDGMLTANIQPEGLQEGDIIVLATTIEHSDPVLKGHVETAFAAWGEAQIGLGHARLSWAPNIQLKLQKTGDLPPPQSGMREGKQIYELTMRDVQPVITPKSAPVRFKLARMGEATDFRSWAEAARLMQPLYVDAAKIPASGPLRDEVEKIRKASADSKIRAEQALQLVQQRVRYVALLMGQGGYVPAAAETTWLHRFGDCKAKTALLLAILHELGIKAEPVLVNPFLGDAIAEQLPMIAWFNHVLIRAHVADRDYWLDGTRSGDGSLDMIEVPDFGWGLPLVDNAQLVHMVPAPRSIPTREHRVSIDAAAGIFAPAPVAIEEVYRGDSAVEMNALYNALSSDQRDEQLRETARGYFDSFTTATSSVKFDQAKREFDIAIKGTAKLGWKDGWLYVPTSSIAFNPDFDRPAGPLHDVPVAINHPRFAKDVATIKLPPGFAAQQKSDPAVHESLAGVEYARSETVSGDTLIVESSERSLVLEVPYKEAVAAVPRLRALDKDDVYLHVAASYAPTDADLAALKDQTPQSANEYFVRAGARLARNDVDGALADLSAGLALDPKNVWALIKRAWIQAGRHEFAAADQDVAAADTVEPGSAEVIGTRAYLAEMKSDFETAAKEYSKLLERAPKNKFARTRRGLSYAGAGKTAEAIQDLTALIAADPKDYGSLLNRATIEARANNLTDAAKDVQAALILKPNDPAVLSSAGRLAEQQGDYRLAVKYYSKQIDAQKASPYFPTLGETPLIGIGGAFAARANAYWILGDYQSAIDDTDHALALGYKPPEVRLLRANIFMKSKREAVAAEADALMRENPASDFAFVAAGRTFAALGQNEKAMSAFDRALSIKPFAYIYLNRSQSRPKTDVAGRMADVDAALKLEPDSSDALAEKARLLTSSGDYKGALAVLDRVKPDPDNHYLEQQRAVLLYKAGRADEAEKLLAAARAGLKSPAELNSLCWAKATADMMLDSAVQDCREALKLSPGNAAYLDSLGMALLRLGKLDEALDAYNQAIAKDTGAGSLMGRAFVYLRRGDRARAEADAAAARKLSANIDDTFADYGLKFDRSSAPVVAAQPAAAGKN